MDTSVSYGIISASQVMEDRDTKHGDTHGKYYHGWARLRQV